LAGLVGSVLGTLLFGVTAHDPPTFVGVAIVCSGAGLLASALPALTAARVDPTAALKGD
jgi:putative ABC transport system permease protein